MEKIYKSKIGLELVIPLILLLGSGLFFEITKDKNQITIGILIFVILFIIHLFMTTNYTIQGNSLTIKSGFLFNKTIDIKTINKISETNNFISSPATSLDRIEINYGKFDSIIISPKQKKQFIAEIILINPSIEVRLKKG